MKHQEAIQYILDRMEKDLADNLYYHSIHHTHDVMEAVKRIAEAEGVDEKEMILLKTAAAYHDAGYMEQYTNNEDIACELIRQTLPGFDYSTSQIELIAELITVTKVSNVPNTHLERIMCDADHDYLGRKDYKKIAATLYKELAEYGFIFNEREWIAEQINFLVNKHQFYTAWAKEERLPVKKTHIRRLQDRIKNL